MPAPAASSRTRVHFPGSRLAGILPQPIADLTPRVGGRVLFRATVPEMVARVRRRPTAALWFIVASSSPVSEQLAGKVVTGARGVEQK